MFILFAQEYGCKVLHFKELEALVDIVKEGLQLDGVVISTPDFNPGFIHTMQYLQQMLTLRVFFIVEEISAQGTPVPFPSNHMYISSFERNGFQEELFSRLRCWFDEGLAPHTHHTRQIKDIALHLHSKSLKVGEFVIELTCKEFELLELLLECQGQYIPTEQILHQLWDRYTSPEIVRQYVYKLRHKNRDHLRTQRHHPVSPGDRIFGEPIDLTEFCQVFLCPGTTWIVFFRILP
ncbi:winged helix-turn-helix domain-containing protein [Paenibacillus rhizoplanae]